jgi:hypothetical protein
LKTAIPSDGHSGRFLTCGLVARIRRSRKIRLIAQYSRMVKAQRGQLQVGWVVRTVLLCSLQPLWSSVSGRMRMRRARRSGFTDVYLAVERVGQVIYVLVSMRRDVRAARRFFEQPIGPTKSRPFEVVADQRRPTRTSWTSWCRRLGIAPIGTPTTGSRPRRTAGPSCTCCATTSSPPWRPPGRGIELGLYQPRHSRRRNSAESSPAGQARPRPLASLALPGW